MALGPVPGGRDRRVTVTHVAVLGAGIMGRGIAYVSALGGFRTVLQDVSDPALDHAGAEISALLEKGVATGKVNGEAAVAAQKRLSTCQKLEDAVAAADLVIEAVPEDITLKVELFGALDRLAPEEAILASNTSSLSISEMAAATRRPTRVVGMHFFNPVHRMRLLEIVRALETAEETLAMAAIAGGRMGKECVVVRESPGFVTSRINAMIGNEAFYMLQEGVASATDIDRALKLGLNHPMGPFELIDYTGVDINLHVANVFFEEFRDPKWAPPPLLKRMVLAGHLGVKSGKGFYEYDENGKRKP